MKYEGTSLRERVTNLERKYLGDTLATEINAKGLAKIACAGMIAGASASNVLNTEPAYAGDIALEFSTGQNPSVALMYSIPLGGSKSKAVKPAYTKFELVGMNPSEQSAKFRYTSNDLGKFFFGLTRPLHIYNTNSEGEKEWLPFYTRPIKAGGILSPLNPSAWKENPSLTLGTLVSEILAVGLYKKHKDKKNRSYVPVPEVPVPEEDPVPEEEPVPEEPIEDPDGGGGGTGGDL